MAMRRSASEPISQTASAIMSAAKATGSAWKLPPDSASSVSAKISGLSETPLASVASVVGRLAQQVERRAHHLRLAAQAIGVLHALVADEVRGADRRCRPSAPRSAAAVSIWPRWRRSAWMRGSNGASEPCAASVDSAPVTSAELEQRLGLEQAGERVGGRELRAVEQRQAFLGAERRAARGRRAPAPRRRACARRRRNDLADADHRRRHVGERREIARGADRALAPGRPGSGRWPASLRAARRVAGRTPEAPCARLASFSAIISRATGTGIGSPTPAAWRQHDVALERREVAGGDAHARELSEAGVDAVDRLAAGEDALRRRRRSPRSRGGTRRSSVGAAPR